MQDSKQKTIKSALLTGDNFSTEPCCGVDAHSLSLSSVPSKIIIRSRIKYGGRGSACKGMFMEYAKCSSIHGIRYLFEVHRPCYEKIFWLTLLATSFYFACSLIRETYLKWQDTPVILGFDETLVPIHKIPFPTITICPEIKMDSKNFHFGNISRQLWQEIEQYGSFKNYANLTEEQITYFATTLHICESDVVERFAKFIPKNVETDVAQTLVRISLKKNQTVPACKWIKRFYTCDSIFTFVATDEGICYQFNGLRNKDIYRDESLVSFNDDQVIDFNNRVEFPEEKFTPLNSISGKWSLEDGYVGQGYNAYPQRAIFSSALNGFYAYMEGYEHNIDYACRNFKQGYKVFFNSPESVPLTSASYISVPHNEEVLVTILPHYIIASKSLRQFNPDKRQCYFNDERYLRYFRYYSQINCQTECLVNYTISQCGCVKFWMPKPLDVPICKVSDIECYSAAEEDLKLKLLAQEMKKALNPNSEIMCDCMPACISLDYNFEISNSRFEISKTLMALGLEYEHFGLLASRIGVYFKTHQITAIKRTELFSITTFISNCGGIFALFMGISSLSIIELIYFCSVRFILNLKRRRDCRTDFMQLASVNYPERDS